MASNVAYELEGRVKLDASQADKELDRATNSAKSKASGWTGLFAKAGQGISNAFSISPDGKLSGWIGQVGSKFTGLREAADKTSANGFGMGAAMGVGMSAFNTLSGGFSALVSDTVDASDSMQKFKSTMKFAGIDDGAINKASKSAKKYADDTVYDLQTITSTTAQLAANGIKNYTGLTEAAGNVNAVAGGNADTFKSVAMVMTQTAGAGKLTTENWNQLADAIPGASGKLQEAMKKNGAYTGNFRDAMANGDITAKEFNKAMMDLGMTDTAKKAAASTATFEGAIGNLQAGIVTKMNNFIDQVGKKNITDLISTAAGGIGTVLTLVGNVISFLMANKATIMGIVDGIVGVIKGIIDAIKAVVDFVVANQGFFTPIAIAAGILAGAILAIVAAVAAFNVVAGIAAVIMSPITLIIVGIIAVITLVVAAVMHWGEIMNWLGQVWTKIKATATTLFTALGAFFVQVWNSIKATFTNVVNAIAAWLTQKWNSIKNTTSSVFNAIKNFFTSVWNSIKNTITNIISTLSGWMTTTFNNIRNTISSIFNAIKNFFTSVWNSIKSTITNVIRTIQNTISSVFNAIRNFISSVWNSIRTTISNVIRSISGTISSVFNAVRNTISSIFNGIKNIASAVWNGILTIIRNAINSVRNVVTSVVNAVANVVSSVFNGVRNTVSSIFGGIQGIASSVWNSILGVVSGAVNGVRNTVSNVLGALGGIASGAFDGVRSAASNVLNGALNVVRGIIDNIKGLFNFNLKFPDISIPHIPMPHFSLSGEFNPLKGKIPKVGVDWYAKGGIMTGPTIFGMNGNRAMVGGEAGREAVLPLNRETLGQIGQGIVDATSTGNEGTVINLYQTINSHEALSPREVARQSRLQFEKAARNL
ncbi:tape measure protein [Bacillus subtilis]|uniref:tape measure protein n=1 Tax=Bacillus subtilis TaxID=1423 RepID=UPI0039834181